MEMLYRKPTETEQKLFLNYDPTVGLKREPKMQQARAITLCQQATRWKWSKVPI